MGIIHTNDSRQIVKAARAAGCWQVYSLARRTVLAVARARRVGEIEVRGREYRAVPQNNR